jgi:hypothetical protein
MRAMVERISCGIYSAKTNIPFRAGKLAGEGAQRQLFNRKPSLCLVFFSERYASYELTHGLLQSVDPESLVGCSTNGEIAYGYRRESVMAMALESKHLCFGAAAVSNNDLLQNENRKEAIDKLYKAALENLQEKLERMNSTSKIKLNDKPDFGIVFLPGTDLTSDLSANSVLHELRQKVGNIPLVGGTIGDDCQYEKGYAICNGEFLIDHSVLILCSSNLSFSMAQKHGYSVTKEFTATETNGKSIVSLDDQPASRAYFSSLRLPVVEVSDFRDKICAINPLGIRDKKTGELQVLFPMSRGKEAQDITVSQNIPEGSKLYLLCADPEKAKNASLAAVKSAFAQSKMVDPRVGLLFSCVGRSTFYFDRAREEISEIKNLFKYTDIGGAYLNGTVAGLSNWVSEGTSSALLLANDLRKDLENNK